MHRRIELAHRCAYDIFPDIPGPSVAAEVLKKISENRRTLFVSSRTVGRLYAASFCEAVCGSSEKNHLLILDCAEKDKTIDLVKLICQRSLDVGLGRDDALVAIGGGVCTDIVTVAASWLYRGIDYFRIPTTLIGQIDAGISIKGALNYGGCKNYLGCFHPPRAVMVVPAFLASLPPRHLISGLAEVIKMAIIRDSDLFSMIEKDHGELILNGFVASSDTARRVIRKSIDDMLDELEPNIFEDQTHQRKVDFGHTFSPALESASGFALTHGEAVSIDIAFSSVLAMQMGVLAPEICDRIISLLSNIGLPIWSGVLSRELCENAINAATLRRGGKPNLVTPTAIGSVRFVESLNELPECLLDESLRDLEKSYLHKMLRPNDFGIEPIQLSINHG